MDSTNEILEENLKSLQIIINSKSSALFYDVQD